jgi:hypothetical protein
MPTSLADWFAEFLLPVLAPGPLPSSAIFPHLGPDESLVSFLVGVDDTCDPALSEPLLRLARKARRAQEDRKERPQAKSHRAQKAGVLHAIHGETPMKIRVAVLEGTTTRTGAASTDAVPTPPAPSAVERSAAGAAAAEAGKVSSELFSSLLPSVNQFLIFDQHFFQLITDIAGASTPNPARGAV